MKSYRKELWFNIPGRRGFVNITPQVQECLRESGIQEGLCLDNTLNITPRIRITDAAGLWAGCTTAPARTPSCTKGQGLAVGKLGRRAVERHGPRRAAVVAVTNGRLDFGTWERIFYGEFDGRRRKRVLVKIIGE